jgi:hypothetical protein
MDPTIRNIKSLKEKLWYFINQKFYNEIFEIKNSNNNDNFYYIYKYDIIKFGKVKYFINDIYFYYPNELDIYFYISGKYRNKTIPVFNFKYEASIPNNNSKEEDKICKICYQDSNEIDNPLVNICKICNGGIKYTHYKCIKKWINTKLDIKENYDKTVKTYTINCFNCELCKTPYPSNNYIF